MTVPFLATPPWPTDGNFDRAAAEYAERVADHAARADAALGLPPALSRVARPARVAAARAAALTHWQGKVDAWNAIPVVEFVPASTGVTLPSLDLR